jgi:DNA polymerase-3 subunit epsilon
MNIVSIDFETANHSDASICAAGMAVFEDGKLTESPYWLVRPPKGHGWFLDGFVEIHGLTHLDVLDAPHFSEIAPEFLAKLTRADLVIAHYAEFDIRKLRGTLTHFGLPCPPFDYLCTCQLARLLVLARGGAFGLDARGKEWFGNRNAEQQTNETNHAEPENLT